MVVFLSSGSNSLITAFSLNYGFWMMVSGYGF